MAAGWLVRDVMTAPAITIPQNASLLVAALTMRRDGVRHLCVTEGVILAGVLSDRDLNRCAPSLLTGIGQEEYNTIFEQTTVEKAMAKNPRSVAPDTPVRAAIALMVEHKLGCLPVVEGDVLRGIVTRSDLLNLLGRFLDGEARLDSPPPPPEPPVV